MSVVLSGNSAATLTAGILLMSRARQFGQRLQVSVVGEPGDITPVVGPTVVHSAVLASCGVGQRPGGGAVVVVGGPGPEPLAVTLANDGIGEWFEIDRAGTGLHPATQALVSLVRSPDRATRRLARELLSGLRALGCVPEPSVVDLMMRAPVSPYLRVALGLRAGRSLGGGQDTPLHSFLDGSSTELPEALPSPCSIDDLRAARADGRLDALCARVGGPARAALVNWATALVRRADTDPQAAVLVCAVVDVVAPVLGLPSPVVLPTLPPAADRVALHLAAALGTTGPRVDASAALRDTFQFLGGRFVAESRFAVQLSDAPPPEDRLGRWRWLCEQTRHAADKADDLWRRVTDPVM